MRKTLLGLLAATAVLAGCATEPPSIGPWGYEFSLGTFQDQRKDEDAKLMAATPFSVDSFMQGWRHNVGRSVFANAQATLDITLNAYEATVSGKSYSLSMDVGLRGRDQYGRPLGTTNASCSAIELAGTAAWGDFWQQAREQGAVTPLTAAHRNATMWQKVMDSCVKDLATQFGTAIAGGVQ